MVIAHHLDVTFEVACGPVRHANLLLRLERSLDDSPLVVCLYCAGLITHDSLAAMYLGDRSAPAAVKRPVWSRTRSVWSTRCC